MTATIVLDSINHHNRIVTFELELPRFLLAEFNTHRQLSRNAQSSRAVPMARTRELTSTAGFTPQLWGQNQPGMQAEQLLDLKTQQQATYTWQQARQQAEKYHELLEELQVHKQLANRILEPFQLTKVVATATHWQNFFHLRTHATAQPEFQELARQMLELYKASKPQQLQKNHWHVPYVESKIVGGVQVFAVEGQEIPLEQALKISASVCAQVSYRRQDFSLQKAEKIYAQLVESTPPHLSPVEHQAEAMDLMLTWPRGCTHHDREGNKWSANFCGWSQWRQQL